MAIKCYHIISLEAKDIYEQELINGVEKGVILPSKKDRAYFGLFKNVLDYSLDLMELEKCYYSKCRNSFKDTLLYYNFRDKVVKAQKDRLKQGHILLPGTNATLFGNGPELLLALSGEFDLHNKPILLILQSFSKSYHSAEKSRFNMITPLPFILTPKPSRIFFDSVVIF